MSHMLCVVLVPLIAGQCTPCGSIRDSGYFEEEGVNRDCNWGNVIHIEQGMRSKVSIALVHDALWEVGHVGRVICRENAVEIVTNGHEVVIVAEVREKDACGDICRYCGEKQICNRRKRVRGSFQVCFPALIGCGPG